MLLTAYYHNLYFYSNQIYNQNEGKSSIRGTTNADTSDLIEGRGRAIVGYLVGREEEEASREFKEIWDVEKKNFKGHCVVRNKERQRKQTAEKEKISMREKMNSFIDEARATEEPSTMHYADMSKTVWRLPAEVDDIVICKLGVLQLLLDT